MKFSEMTLRKPSTFKPKHSCLDGMSFSSMMGLEKIGQAFDGSDIVLVEDEESGTVSYMIKTKDGHLGGLGGE